MLIWRNLMTKFCRIFNFFAPIKLEMHSIRPAKQNMLPTAQLNKERNYNLFAQSLNEWLNEFEAQKLNNWILSLTFFVLSSIKFRIQYNYFELFLCTEYIKYIRIHKKNKAILTVFLLCLASSIQKLFWNLVIALLLYETNNQLEWIQIYDSS
jgi:hypothetical protein